MISTTLTEDSKLWRDLSLSNQRWFVSFESNTASIATSLHCGREERGGTERSSSTLWCWQWQRSIHSLQDFIKAFPFVLLCWIWTREEEDTHVCFAHRTHAISANQRDQRRDASQIHSEDTLSSAHIGCWPLQQKKEKKFQSVQLKWPAWIYRQVYAGYGSMIYILTKK